MHNFTDQIIVILLSNYSCWLVCYTEMERELAHTLLTGYLKGGEQASASMTFDVTSKLGTTSEYSFPGHTIPILPRIPSKIQPPVSIIQ